MKGPTPTRTLWRLAIAVWATAGAAGVATLVLRGQRPAAMDSLTCTVDRTGAARWFTSGAGDEASAEAPSDAELGSVDALAIGIAVDAPARAIVSALLACAREDALAVAVAAPEATSASPSFAAIAPRPDDPLAIDSDPVTVSPAGDGAWRIETLALAVEAPALEVGPALARLRGPGREISARQPIEIRCGAERFEALRDVLVGVLRDAPEARIVLVGEAMP
jgi:hypothetical protein